MVGPLGARRRNCTSPAAFLAALVVLALALALRHARKDVVELQGKLEALGKPWRHVREGGGPAGAVEAL